MKRREMKREEGRGEWVDENGREKRRREDNERRER